MDKEYRNILGELRTLLVYSVRKLFYFSEDKLAYDSDFQTLNYNFVFIIKQI